MIKRRMPLNSVQTATQNMNPSFLQTAETVVAGCGGCKLSAKPIAQQDSRKNIPAEAAAAREHQDASNL